MFKQDLHQYPLSQAVRNGRCGTNPNTLTHFLSACEDACQCMSTAQARQTQVDVLEIILETICDSMVDKCWRGWCLDNAYRPLRNIRLLSKTPQEKSHLISLEAEMRTLSNYFLT